MIRRILTPRGVRYIENGRFVNSRRGGREWVRQNIDTIRTGRTQGFRYEDLTTRERQSYSAQNRWRFNGQFVSNPYGFFNQFIPVTRGDRNLDRFFSRQDLRQLSEFTLDLTTTHNAEGDLQRTRGELFDIANSFRDYITQGYQFNLITTDGEILSNFEAIDYLRNWESETIDTIRQRGRETNRELDRIRINYETTINREGRTIELDLNDIDYDTDIEAYFDS